MRTSVGNCLSPAVKAVVRSEGKIHPRVARGQCKLLGSNSANNFPTQITLTTLGFIPFSLLIHLSTGSFFWKIENQAIGPKLILKSSIGI